jgi:hypothetical protein
MRTMLCAYHVKFKSLLHSSMKDRFLTKETQENGVHLLRMVCFQSHIHLVYR